MIQKIKTFIMVSANVLMLSGVGLVPFMAASPLAASAACNGSQAALTGGVDNAVNGTNIACDAAVGGANGESAVQKIALTVVKVFSIIVGAVAVFMIIYGGFRYITSGGDSGKVGSAKNTLIYALVGLIIVALAQIIVHFIISQAVTATA